MRQSGRIKSHLLFFGSFVGYFRALWLGFIHIVHILMHNCKNIEDHTKIVHGLDFSPWVKLANQLISKINKKHVNMVEELANDMPDANAKSLTKAMLKAVKEEYQRGTYIPLISRVPPIWH